MANKEIDYVPFIKDYFYLHLHSNGMSLRKFMSDYGDEIGRTEKTIRRYLENGQAPKRVVKRIADILNVGVGYLMGREDCSDTITFLREYRRMCNNHFFCHKGCQIDQLRSKYNLSCVVCLEEHPEEAVALVQKWSDEHPAKCCK